METERDMIINEKDKYGLSFFIKKYEDTLFTEKHLMYLFEVVPKHTMNQIVLGNYPISNSEFSKKFAKIKTDYYKEMNRDPLEETPHYKFYDNYAKAKKQLLLKYQDKNDLLFFQKNDKVYDFLIMLADNDGANDVDKPPQYLIHQSNKEWDVSCVNDIVELTKNINETGRQIIQELKKRNHEVITPEENAKLLDDCQIARYQLFEMKRYFDIKKEYCGSIPSHFLAAENQEACDLAGQVVDSLYNSINYIIKDREEIINTHEIAQAYERKIFQDFQKAFEMNDFEYTYHNTNNQQEVRIIMPNSIAKQISIYESLSNKYCEIKEKIEGLVNAEIEYYNIDVNKADWSTLLNPITCSFANSFKELMEEIEEKTKSLWCAYYNVDDDINKEFDDDTDLTI